MNYDMVFIVNTLGMHGGTTFVNRFSKLSYEKNKKILVFCLFNDTDPTLLESISKYAEVVYLSEYLLFSALRKQTKQIDVFLPLNREKLKALLNGTHLHIMGLFGLYFVSRLIPNLPDCSASVGLYQQYEYKVEHRREYFCRCLTQVLKKIYPQQLVFFNENNRLKFGVDWGIATNNSTVTPIGIEIKCNHQADKKRTNFNLISVGNLVGFKSYAKLVISIIPELLNKYPDISYDIIGDGPEHKNLSELCAKLGISHVVNFHGRLPFSSAMERVERSAVFIGSGTALLEAAARFVPSIIGIEAEQEPCTYGFIHQISGYDYNEQMHGRNKFKIIDCIDSVLSSDSNWLDVSRACYTKAIEFGIEKTHNDFFELANLDFSYIKLNNLKEINLRDNILSLISFIKIALYDLLGIDRTFRFRREFDE